MEILPAIDLRSGRVVRLAQGDYSRQTTYSQDAAGVARDFAAAGARWIHVVDLDAARTGRPSNVGPIRDVRAAVDLKIELGGGARDERTVDFMLAELADRVIVGSAALEDWAWFERLAARGDLAGRIALGLDARAGRLAVRGWEKPLDAAPLEIARRVTGWPLGAIVYTDIARDGMLTGVNVEATGALIAATDVPVIAAGGVGSLDDLRRCKGVGCAGAIIGRAYYEGRIRLAEALAVAGG